MRRLAMGLAIGFVVSTGAAVPAKAECVDYAGFAHWSGGVVTPGAALSVAVSGDLAYVADGNSGLTIVDVSDPQIPKIVSTVPTVSFARDVTVLGDFAYLACGNAGLVTVDVSNPSDPFVTGSTPVVGSANGVATENGMLYVVSIRFGVDGRLSIFDPVVAADPLLRGVVWTPFEPVKVIAEGSIVFVPDTICFEKGCFGGIGAYDVSDPDNPIELGHVPTGELTGADVEGALAYACSTVHGLYVINVADPTNMQLVMNVPEIVVNDVEIRRDLAFMASEGLQIADFGKGIGSYGLVDIPTPPTGSARRLVVAGDRAYLVDNGVLQIVRVTEAETLPLVGKFDTPELAMGLQVENDIAYVTDGAAGLHVLDVSDPTMPRLRSSADTQEQAVDVDVVDGRAYIADKFGGLAIIDVSDPDAATVLGQRRSVGLSIAVAARPPYAFVGDVGSVEQQGFRVFDVSNPNTPIRVAGFVLDDDPRDIDIVDDTAYLALDGDGVARIDISDPLAPALVDVTSFGGGAARAILMLSTPTHPVLGAVVGPDLGLRVVDFGDPAGPTEIGSIDLPGNGVSLGKVGEFVAVGTDANQVLMLSLATPRQPVVIGGMNALGVVEGVAAGTSLYVTQGKAGLAIFPAPCPTTVGVAETTRPIPRLANAPNPFRPATRISFRLARRGPATLRVYDTTGRLVRTLLDEDLLDAGNHVSVWDGRTLTGHVAAPGVYPYVLETGLGSYRGKAIKVR